MRVTTEKIIFEFLKQRLELGVDTISSHHFAIDIVNYGELYWDTTKLPDTYTRSWRKIRETKSYSKIDVTDVQEVEHKGAEGKWKLIQDTSK